MSDYLLSEAEKTFILHGVQSKLRSDGRGNSDYRPISVATNVIAAANGSARVKLGETQILVGVKVNIDQPSKEKPDEGKVELFVECSTNAMQELKHSQDKCFSLASALRKLYANETCFDRRKLCLLPGHKCFVLSVDVWILEYGGNLLDAAALAIKSALFSARIPKININQDDEGRIDLEVSDDPYDMIRLPVDNIPLYVTLFRIGNSFVADANQPEAACSVARLSVGVCANSRISAICTEGGGSFDPETITEMIHTAEQLGPCLHEELMTQLEKEEAILSSRGLFSASENDLFD